MSKTIELKHAENPDEIPAGTQFLYADTIKGIEFGSSITKVTYAMTTGEVVAVMVIPTLPFVEIVQRLSESFLTDTNLRNSILPGLDALKGLLAEPSK